MNRSWRTRVLIAAVATVVVVGAVCLAILAWLVPPAPHSSTSPSPNASRPVSPPTATATPAPTARPTPSPGADQSDATTVPSSSVPTPGSTGAWRAPAGMDVAARAEEVASRRGISVSIAWYEPGAGVRHGGELSGAPAWSTSKVPLALAVIHAGDGETRRANISAALRSSSNEAADALWRSLGPDDRTRAEAVTDVLRRAGDPRTVVPHTRDRPPYSIFGQTAWSTEDQVTFLMHLPELTGSTQVITDMRSVTDSQRWGIGRLPGATFKGGWGPTPTGGYTVRQLGWYVGTDGARIPLAVAVQADSFDAGVSALDELLAGLR